jgi:dTDP-4-amino-4,6-dideoxygalactose transaminase
MKTILAPRASSILYDILKTGASARPFLLPANICPIVPITFLKAGIPFEFVDISPGTLAMDLDQIEARLHTSSANYGGLLYAHTYGDPSTPIDFFELIKRRWPALTLIDDRCLCIPQAEPDSPTVADVVLFSTGYAKIVDLGYGGFAFLQDHVACTHQSLPFDAEHLETLESEYKTHVRAGAAYSYQDSSWLQTDSLLPSWQEFANELSDAARRTLSHRRSLNAVYNSLVPRELQLPQAFQLWRFNLRLERKAAILEAIFSAGLFASSHYASLVGIMGSGRDENARALARQVMNLFNDEHYTLDMAERTARVVRRSL